jgi:hypothetical protein
MRVVRSAPIRRQLPAAERIRFNEGFRACGAHRLDLSSNARSISTDTGAFVQFEKPGIVIDAIREVYDQTK